MIAAFFDVDGTITESRVWNGIHEYFTERKQRLFTHAVFLGIHYFLYILYKLGFIQQVQFRRPWARNLSWYFRGFTQTQAEEMWDWVIENRIRQIIRPDVSELLKQHREAGHKIFLVSGGPVGLLEQIAKEVGADYAVGTMHEFKNGRYTGRAASEACQGENKATFAKYVARQAGLEIDYAESFAYADSMADVNLFEMVGHPVAVYPDAELKALAQERGWPIFPESK